ncbi:unnamed protein product [Phaedon cochleariae]|uniref:Charged multivesicular body protein 7 n=1 Tax=Phaedon cochleariae TaxID=80249 RepID=A0A9P0DMB7_PHACE|nr:unnamed protein product [Phaedon cochleariae]
MLKLKETKKPPAAHWLSGKIDQSKVSNIRGYVSYDKDLNKNILKHPRNRTEMFQISQDNLPDCLKDEQRINVLFAPLRNRSVNSKDWDNKISSWKNIIKAYCQSNEIYTFTLVSLNNVFVRNGRPPSCLTEVISDMHKNGEIQPIHVFLRKPSESWGGWATETLIKRPFSWSLNKIKNTVFTIDLSQQSFVHLEVIKCKCDELLNSIPEKCRNKLISLKTLLSLLSKNSTKAEDVKLLLHYLANQNLVALTEFGNSKQRDELEAFLIKFSDGNGNEVNSITEIDLGIYTLEQNELVLSKGIEELEDNIESYVKEAKVHLTKNHRQLAKSSLRKKHDLEKRLEKKAIALRNVQTLLEKIHDTHSDAHVFEAYKNAVSTFNTSFKYLGLSEDNIDDTMIKLGEMLDKHDDIQSALARPAQDSILDDSDLEDELADLLKDVPDDQPPDDSGMNTSNVEKQLENMNINMPEVPDASPDVSQQGEEVLIH